MAHQIGNGRDEQYVFISTCDRCGCDPCRCEPFWYLEDVPTEEELAAETDADDDWEEDHGPVDVNYPDEQLDFGPGHWWIVEE